MEVWWYSSTILKFDIRWSSVISFTFSPFYPYGKIPWYSLDGRLGGSYADLDAVEKRNSLLASGNQTPAV
jgi:hypothetical protein